LLTRVLAGALLTEDRRLARGDLAHHAQRVLSARVAAVVAVPALLGQGSPQSARVMALSAPGGVPGDVVGEGRREGRRPVLGEVGTLALGDLALDVLQAGQHLLAGVHHAALGLVGVQALLLTVVVLGDLDLVRLEGDGALAATLVLIAVDHPVVPGALHPVLVPPGDPLLVGMGVQPAGGLGMEAVGVVGVRLALGVLVLGVARVVVAVAVLVGPLLVLVVVLGRRGHVLVVVVARLPLVLVDLLVHVVLGVVDLGVLQVQLDVHDVAHRTLVVLGQVVGVGVVTAGELLGHGVVGREVVADQRVPVLVPVGVLLHRRVLVVRRITEVLEVMRRTVVPLLRVPAGLLVDGVL